VVQGGGKEAAAVKQALTDLDRSRYGVPDCFLAALGEACWKNGRHAEALSALVLGVARAQETGSNHYDAEFLRLRADILLDRGKGIFEKAGNLLHRALEIARHQEARWFELRAATSLARLLCDRGRRDEARALLQPVYGWFTEGFDLPDVKNARALLEEL